MAIDGNNKDQKINFTAQELQEFAKYTLTKEYLRRALSKLNHAKQFFDQEIDEVDEEEESITKFIAEVKRKNLI